MRRHNGFRDPLISSFLFPLDEEPYSSQLRCIFPSAPSSLELRFAAKIDRARAPSVSPSGVSLS